MNAAHGAHRDRREELRNRVVAAAAAALARNQYVTPIDILTGARMLLPVQVQQWRKGRIDFLEQMIQGSP